MATALLVGRLVLAATFLVAGVSKLFDRRGFTSVLKDTGVPPRSVSAFALLLPLLEVLIALGLTIPESADYAALTGLVLLCTFVAGITLNLFRGRRLRCNCFGTLSSSTMSFKTIVRNLVLIAIALFIMMEGRLFEAPLTGLSWISKSVLMERPLFSMLVFVLLILALQGYLLIYLLTQYGKLLSRFETIQRAFGPVEEPPPLPVGTPAPPFNLAALDGATVNLESLRASGNPVALVFLSTDCGPCKTLLPLLGSWQRALGDVATVVAISSGDAAAMRALKNEHGLRLVLMQEGEEVADAYRAMGTPSAVVVNSQGLIDSDLALGTVQVEELLHEIAEEPRSHNLVQRIGA